jgi:hypothetical protein
MSDWHHTHMPFFGDPPAVKAGDRVQIQTADGQWVERTALSEPRYDRPNAVGKRCYLTVLVDLDGYQYHCVEFRDEDDPGPGYEPTDPVSPDQMELFDPQPWVRPRMYADVVAQARDQLAVTP